MEFRHTTYLLWTLLLGSIALAHPAFAQRLGLHVTQEELNIWKQRASSGPYKTTGDVSTNSPGDWTRIQNNASAFLSSPSSERWSGQPAGSCWMWSSNPPAIPGRTQGDRLRDAAFVYLLTGNTTYRDAVVNELLAQAATAGTNWTDSVRWQASDNCLSGDSWSWEISVWIRKLLYAYDYIRPGISAGNRTTLDTWFINAATLFNANTDATGARVFPNRLSDDYSTSPFSRDGGGGISGLTHFGGYNTYWFSEHWSNRTASHILVVGLTGLVVGNTTFQDRAKRWFREWVQYAIYADGTSVEFNRWTSSFPALGWSYSGTVIAEMAMLADAFARAGDTSLYNFSTSDGFGTIVPAGGPKSLLQIITQFMRFVDGTMTRYGTDQAGNNGNPAYRIRSTDGLAGHERINDIWLAPANVFYKNAYIKSVYLRQAPGAPSYPANPTGGGHCVYCGEWGTLPGVLFMFGQMEDRVSPPGGTNPPPPSSSGPISVDSTYPGYSVASIDDGVVNATGETAATWASAESTVDPHWITIAFSSPKQLNTAIIYWAFNNIAQTYMTAQQVDFQYWNGSSFQTVGSFTYTGDVPSSTITFPTVTTSQIRFYQPASKGNGQYTTVLWVTEVDYGNVATSQPPTAPTGLVAVSQ